jgi:hypothetical protein
VLSLTSRSFGQRVLLDRPRMFPLRSLAIESPLELVVVLPTMRFCPSRSVKTFMSFVPGHHSTGHLEPTEEITQSGISEKVFVISTIGHSGL